MGIDPASERMATHEAAESLCRFRMSGRSSCSCSMAERMVVSETPRFLPDCGTQGIRGAEFRLRCTAAYHQTALTKDRWRSRDGSGSEVFSQWEGDGRMEIKKPYV